MLLERASILVALVLFCSGFRTLADETGEAEVPRWRHAKVELVFHESDAVGLNLESVLNAMRVGASQWQDADCSDFQISITDTTTEPVAPGDGVNTIQWLDTAWEGKGFNPREAAHSDIQVGETGSGELHVVEVDVYMNAVHYRWQAGADSDEELPEDFRDARSVIAHEVGHMLGLADSCARNDDECPVAFEATTMHPEYRPNQWQLSDDDVAGLCFLYPVGDCLANPCQRDQLCRDGACLPLCYADVCDSGETCTEDGCLRECTPERCDIVCDDDSECGPNARCDEERCTAGRLQAGDPCKSTRECEVQACVGGICAEQCSVETANSRDGGSCVEGRGLGEGCARDSQCISGLCSEAGECTRDCSEARACPSGWTCTGKEDGECTRSAEKAGACTLVTPGPAPWCLCLVGSVLVLGATRRFRLFDDKLRVDQQLEV